MQKKEAENKHFFLRCLGTWNVGGLHGVISRKKIFYMLISESLKSNEDDDDYEKVPIKLNSRSRIYTARLFFSRFATPPVGK
jgi:hypothetical protein